TDFAGEAWEGFVRGRQLLAEAAGPLSADQLDALRAHRDQALGAWEKAIASTVVHYINDTLQDMAAVGTDAWSLADHAKHWSELKGFALALQFNPHAAITDAQLVQLHALLGQAPVLSGEEALAAYADDLIAARTLVGTAYGFSSANLGDDD